MVTARWIAADVFDGLATIPDGSVDLVVTCYGGVMPKRASIYERWLEKVDVAGENECWEWRASRDADGYGRFQYPADGGGQVHMRAHRWAYQFFVGVLEPGMVIMHTCDNRACVNPRHLRQDTPRANNDDKVAKGRHALLWGTPLARSRQTHCRRGHPFDAANTRYRERNGRIHRRCKACERINARQDYWKQRGGDANGGEVPRR